MSGSQWITIILLGGIMGLLGQGVRAAMGMQKLKEESEAAGHSAEGGFRSNMFLSSLLTGFVAGALASFTVEFKDTSKIEVAQLMGMFAAGYAGTDFIENTAKRFLPRTGG